MAILRVDKAFLEMLQDGSAIAIEAKIRLSREWYSDVRQLERHLDDIEERINCCCNSDDDIAERAYIMYQIDLYRGLLEFFAFDPLHDPEHSEEVLLL